MKKADKIAYRKKISNKIFMIIAFILVTILIIRIFMPREIDDVNPFMNCSLEDLERSDVFYVVPLYKDVAINESREWCKYILDLNRTLCLHGIRHNFEEFKEEIDSKDLEYAIAVFEDCFNKTPSCFKPPQLTINSENKKLLESYDLKSKGYLDQLFRKVYHCNDSGLWPNWLQNLF
jgi:hypothetical protein